MTLSFFKDFEEIFNGCVFYLDNTITDAIKNAVIANTGVGVTGTDRFGRANKSLIFNGSSYLDVADSADFTFGTGAYLIAMVITPITTGGGSPRIFNHVDAANEYIHELYWYSTGYLRWLSDSFAVESSNAMSSGNTYRVILLNTGSVQTIYLNGVSQGSGSNSSDVADMTSTFTIGAAADHSGDIFTGNLDHFMVWKTTVPDVAQLDRLMQYMQLYPLINAGRFIE